MDPDEPRVIRSFARRGDGPTEFRGVTTVLSAPGDSGHGWVFTANGRKLVRFPVTADPAEAGSHRVIRLSPTSSLVNRVRWIAKDRLLGTGWFPDGTFVEFDGDGVPGTPFGPLPGGPEDAPTSVRHTLFIGEIVANRRLSIVARASINGGQVDLFDFLGRERGAAEVPTSFVPELTPPDPTSEEPEWEYRHMGNRAGYWDLAATDDLIFALFSGGLRTGNILLDDDDAKGHEVQVFTWSGELVQVFELDAVGTIALAVDPEARRMWTLVWDPEPAIRFYSIDNLLPAEPAAGAVRD